MKLFIPELKQKLKLIEPWTFDLYYEARNLTLVELVVPSLEKALEAKRQEYLEDYRKSKCNNWAHWTQYNDTYKSFVIKKHTFPAGTILEVDRIYIKSRNSDYSSFTFKIRGSKKVIRFWAKLDDVVNIDFELVT